MKKTEYSIEGFDGRVYLKVWKKRYARCMVRNDYDREAYGFPNEGVCYKIKRNGKKKFAFMW